MGIDDVFAVIAEGTRRQILERLRDGDRAVGELVIDLQVSQPTVSKHLKVLREVGLVTMRAQGQKRYYALRTEPLEQVRSWLGGFEAPVSGEVEAGAVAPADADAQAGDGPAPAVPAGADDVEHVTDGAAIRPEVPTVVLVADSATDALGPRAGEPAPDVLAAAVLAGAAGASTSDSLAVSVATPGPEAVSPIGRTMGRAAERAADLLAQLRRRRDPSS
jgi:DNA-binding transcriptional ArsR family regulator